MPICECGCGVTFERETRRGALRRFIAGHQFRSGREKLLATKKSSRILPPPDQRWDGNCCCGCGGSTQIAVQTVVALGWYLGYPKPYIRGHKPKLTGLKNPQFTGRRRDEHGYVYVFRPDHPAARRRKRSMRGYVLEHRVVMEDTIGRFLTDAEHVHHVNGIRDDNRPENLAIVTRSEHRRIHQKDDRCTDETRRKLSTQMTRVWAERRSKQQYQ